MCLPWPVQRATAAAAPNSMSSGWATIAIAFDQFSGRLLSGSGSMRPGMTDIDCRGTPGSGRVPQVIRISEVDPADDVTLRAFWDTEQASVWADREHAIPRSW